MVADAVVEVLRAALPPCVLRANVCVLAIEEQPRVATIEVLLFLSGYRRYLLI
jgi:hypothetical protein